MQRAKLKLGILVYKFWFVDPEPRGPGTVNSNEREAFVGTGVFYDPQGVTALRGRRIAASR